MCLLACPWAASFTHGLSAMDLFLTTVSCFHNKTFVMQYAPSQICCHLETDWTCRTNRVRDKINPKSHHTSMNCSAENSLPDKTSFLANLEFIVWLADGYYCSLVFILAFIWLKPPCWVRVVKECSAVWLSFCSVVLICPSFSVLPAFLFNPHVICLFIIFSPCEMCSRPH